MGKGIHWEWRKRLKFGHAVKWHIHKPKSVQENESHKILWNFKIQINHPIPVRKSDLVLKNKKKIASHLVDFDVPVEHKGTVKECETQDKCLDLSRELKKFWNMKVIVIRIVVGTFRTAFKNLEKRSDDLEIWRTTETIQTTTLLKSLSILRRMLQHRGDLLSL